MIGDAIAGLIGKVFDRAWPDPASKAAAALELEKLRQGGEFKAIDAELSAMQMQADTNRVEAASADPFVSRWRPFIGWVCGWALAWHYLGRPIASWAAALAGIDAQIPSLDLGDLITLLLGMLGMGGLRTAEKIKGVAS